MAFHPSKGASMRFIFYCKRIIGVVKQVFLFFVKYINIFLNAPFKQSLLCSLLVGMTIMIYAVFCSVFDAALKIDIQPIPKMLSDSGNSRHLIKFELQSLVEAINNSKFKLNASDNIKFVDPSFHVSVLDNTFFFNDIIDFIEKLFKINAYKCNIYFTCDNKIISAECEAVNYAYGVKRHFKVSAEKVVDVCDGIINKLLDIYYPNLYVLYNSNKAFTNNLKPDYDFYEKYISARLIYMNKTDAVSALSLLGSILIEKNDLDNALKKLELALQLDDKNFWALKILGSYYYSLSKYGTEGSSDDHDLEYMTSSIRAFEKYGDDSYSQRPDLVAQENVKYLKVCSTNECKENNEAAFNYYSKVAKLYGDEESVLYAISCLEHLGKIGDIVGFYESLPRSVKDHVSPQVEMAVARWLTFQGRYKDAILKYKKIEQTRPCNDNLYYNYSNTLAMSGDFDAAIKKIQLAIDINPNVGKYHYCLGRYYNDNKMYDNSIKELVSALQIDTESNMSRTYHNYLGHLYEEKGFWVVSGKDNADTRKSNEYFDKAENEYSQAIDLPDDDNNVVTYFNDLMSIYNNRFKYHELLKYCPRRLRIAKMLDERLHENKKKNTNNDLSLIDRISAECQRLQHIQNRISNNK